MHFPRFFSVAARGLAVAAAVSLFAFSPALRAQEPVRNSAQSAESHLVAPAQLDQQVQAATRTRQNEIQDLTQFLSTPQAVKAMKDAKVDAVQVKTAIPTLSDTELAELSARADRAQHDFAAGAISNQTLLIIILVLVAVILIAVIH
ncbi:MAG TPA: hypothetical protein VL990_05475 [Acidobacteriaceae bacterium]|nr:hypothetical protein [Acidobacteriaceae bacterium]